MKPVLLPLGSRVGSDWSSCRASRTDSSSSRSSDSSGKRCGAGVIQALDCGITCDSTSVYVCVSITLFPSWECVLLFGRESGRERGKEVAREGGLRGKPSERAPVTVAACLLNRVIEKKDRKLDLLSVSLPLIPRFLLCVGRMEEGWGRREGGWWQEKKKRKRRGMSMNNHLRSVRSSKSRHRGGSAKQGEHE